MQLTMMEEFISGKGTIGVSSHEPNDSFYMYQLNNNVIDDYSAIPNGSDFVPFSTDIEQEPPSIATVDVDEFGVKNLIGWGAAAFYHPTDSDVSYVVLPIHNSKKYSAPPIVDVVVDGNEVVFDIESTNDYDCARMIVSQGNIREERVEYFRKDRIAYRMEVSFVGEVSISVQAYKDELGVISQKFHTKLSI